MENKTSNLSNGLLWFGAAVSMAEILTGTLIAPLGMAKGILAIVTGHLIGIILFYLAGLVGAKSKLAAIESSRISFGKYGSYLFSVLNILQLVGWTAVMIIVAGKALDQISISMFGFSSETLWCIIIGLLIAVWIIVGIKKLEKINIFAIGALFVLTVILSTVVFKPATAAQVQGSMTFGMAVEFSVTMTLSWLPLVADYTRYAKKEVGATVFSSIGYFIGSCWMFIIGLGATIYIESADIGQILLSSGLGIAALLIVIMSTVTTTYLDAFSAGVSVTNIGKNINEKWAAIIVCIIGTIVAIRTPMDEYQNFLMLIGAVFAPMFSILLTDYFILKKRDVKGLINTSNIILWVAGSILYLAFFIMFNTALGSSLPSVVVSFISYTSPITDTLGYTLPVMVLISLLSIIIHGGKKLCLKK